MEKTRLTKMSYYVLIFVFPGEFICICDAWSN